VIVESDMTNLTMKMVEQKLAALRQRKGLKFDGDLDFVGTKSVTMKEGVANLRISISKSGVGAATSVARIKRPKA